MGVGVGVGVGEGKCRGLKKYRKIDKVKVIEKKT